MTGKNDVDLTCFLLSKLIGPIPWSRHTVFRWHGALRGIT